MLHFSLWNGGNKENWIQNSSLVQEFGFHGISKDLVIMTLLSNAHSRHLCQNLVEYSFYFIIHNKTYKDVLGESFLGLLMLKWFLTITLSKARISFLVTVRAFWSWLDNPDHLVLKVWSAVGLISWSSMVSDWHSLVNSFNIHRYCVCHKYILFNFSCHIMTDIYMQVHEWASVHVGGVFFIILNSYTLTFLFIFSFTATTQMLKWWILEPGFCSVSQYPSSCWSLLGSGCIGCSWVASEFKLFKKYGFQKQGVFDFIRMGLIKALLVVNDKS